MGEEPKADVPQQSQYSVVDYESPALSARYASLYMERQILNWSPVDVVVTYFDGQQDTLLKWNNCRTTRNEYAVCIEMRKHYGMRVSEDKFGTLSDLRIPAKKYTIPYDNFIPAPVIIHELGLIISTVEQSLIARNMAMEISHPEPICETLSDDECTDPRLVFKVEDPNYRWDHLWLFVMGQTIKVNATHGMGITDIDHPQGGSESNELPKLSCYLRYPTNSSFGERKMHHVFTINLGDIDREEPYELATGDIICIAETKEALARVMMKKHEQTNTAPQIQGMISKEVHDSIVESLNNQITEEKASSKKKLESVQLANKTEVESLNYKLETEKRKNEELKSQLNSWQGLHDQRMEQAKKEEQLAEQRAKTQAAICEASRKEAENTWFVAKIGIGLAATALGYVITTIIKNKK